MADVAMFGPGKTAWVKEVGEWKRSSGNKQLTHCDFVTLLKKITERMTEEKIKNGFKDTGIFPLNQENLQLDRCIGADNEGDCNDKTRLKPGL